MHRLLVLKTAAETSGKFMVVADSSNPKISTEHPVSLVEAGCGEWIKFPDESPEFSSFALFPLPCKASISEIGFWFVNKTGKTAQIDYAADGITELKVVTSGELHLEYEGRNYSASVGGGVIFWVDPNDKDGGKIRPFVVEFKGDHECTVVYTECYLP